MSGNTYAGHATCCAAALANIEIIERERLLDRSAAEGARLFDLCKRFGDSPLVGRFEAGEVWPWGSSFGRRACPTRSRRRRATSGCPRPAAHPIVIPVSPPLVVTPEEVTAIVEAVEALERSRAACIAGGCRDRNVMCTGIRDGGRIGRQRGAGGTGTSQKRSRRRNNGTLIGSISARLVAPGRPVV